MARHGLLDTIGNTPIVRLERLPGENAAEIWVKLEGANPTGSYKDRMALAMIEEAERSGRLAPGQTVVEYTGGSTGSSLALVCALTGHPLRIVTSDAYSNEKLATMRAFGAVLEVVPSPEGITPTLIPTLRARAAELVVELGGYATDQFRNHDMVTGYRRMGEEIAEQIGHVDVVCLYVGTAGCFLGVTAALSERFPNLHRVVVEPEESAVLSGRAPGTHRIEGGGAGFRPEQLVDGSFDEVMTVATTQAFAMARRLARTEGVFSGPSTGANVTAALGLAERFGSGCRVVTAQVDSGMKYLSGALYSEP